MRRGRRGVGMIAVDLFAGPGGWDVAAHWLGVDPLGIEWDDAACRVREAAGLRTLQADVAALDPKDFPCDLLIASPPCTAFSMAGKGEGRRALDTLLAAVRSMGAGASIDKETLDEACSDETAHLVLEPLRWALALSPRLVCCEQVPPALPVWEAMEPILRARGYSTWSGVLSAEQYGVPQTRRRAFLIASLDGPVAAPAPTHQRYVALRSRDDEGGGLFELPDAERIVAPGDGELLPWVSMAEALGWGMTARPSVTVVSRSSSQGSPDPLDGGSGARALLREARESGRWVMRANANANANACVRAVDEPAPTITGGHDHGDRVWKVRTNNFGGNRGPDGERSENYERPTDQPSPTVGSRADLWQLRSNARTNSAVRGADEPAPTMYGKSCSIFPGPRNERNHDYQPGDGPVSQANDVRVTMEQAACLQSFPSGYPWEAAGSRSAAFRCIGNAVPPLMARGVLQAVVR